MAVSWPSPERSMLKLSVDLNVHKTRLSRVSAGWGWWKDFGIPDKARAPGHVRDEAISWET